MTRSPMKPKSVRTGYDKKSEVRGTAELKALEHLLKLDNLRPVQNKWGVDTRLVIDLLFSDNAIRTFVASRTQLCDLAAKICRPIDASFRKQFSFVENLGDVQKEQ
tara:strand:+ start:87 stop:404 length:318 start_codon:yes stop_codon:yes gene_type:complete